MTETAADPSYLSPAQVDLLLRPVNRKRVTRRNDNGQAHMEGYDIRAELTRVFGFGRWSAEVVDQTLIREAQVKLSTGGNGWNVVYRTRMRLTVKAPDGTPLSVQEATHIGENSHPSFGESHGNAVTNSETYALRRCAINFGDQFGLSLYNKGSLEPVVRWTLVRPQADKPADTDDVPDVNPEQEDGGGAEIPDEGIPYADMRGWRKRTGAADSSAALAGIRTDMEKLRDGGELNPADVARIAGMLDARAAEIDSESRQPDPDGPGDAAQPDWAESFKARLAAAGADCMRPMKVEVLRAVSSNVITPPAGTELIALVKQRATALEGATNDDA
ncbi:MAG TPA: Rad52/Rad22 family DNA repair protein [Trebonia sp.]|jgi:hypothetical protein